MSENVLDFEVRNFEVRNFEVRKNNLRHYRVLSAPGAALGQEGVRVRIEHFALTANNITYAAFGEAMKYWNFFPAEDGYGRIPVWGFADVLESNAKTVMSGTRIYGYFPMSSELVIGPVSPREDGFFDGAAHRQEMSPIYNRYMITKADPSYNADHEAEHMLLRPLFMTSFMIDDFMEDNSFFGAKTVIISSASSKTAIGTAWALARRKNIEVIGLTSGDNAGFVAGLGCYSRTVSYEDTEKIKTSGKVVYVDMSGNGPLRTRIHAFFNDRLAYSCAVGGTHWEQQGNANNLPGPRPELFFAPTQIEKRHKDWGATELNKRFAQSWEKFVAFTQTWMEIEYARGSEAAGQAYLQMLEGKTSPRKGQILSL